ncbi:MAG TPA: hypothetical protein VIJ94_17365 [Caulobacteraceae bacterium]
MSIIETAYRAAKMGADNVLPAGTEHLVRAAEMVDWQGEAGLSIDVVVPDNFFEREDVGDKLIELTDYIRRELLAAGENRFPYVELSPKSAAA